MTDTVLDCHHADITHIVEARAVARYSARRRLLNRLLAANDLEFTPMQYSMMNVSAP